MGKVIKRLLRSRAGITLLLAVFLLFLLNTNVRAALFSGINFLGRSLADEFNRILVNTLDSRTISENEVPVIIKPVESEEKGVEEFVPLGSAELVSAGNNNNAYRPILASSIAPTSYSVSGSGDRYNSGAAEPDEISGFVPMEEQILSNEEKAQLEQAKLQEELLKQLLSAAEKELATAGQSETAAAETISVAGPAPAEQTSTKAEDIQARHEDAAEAIDNVKQLLSKMQQETSMAQSKAVEGAASCCADEGESVSESASFGETNASTSTSLQQGSDDEEVETSTTQAMEGYYCSGGVCYPKTTLANSNTSVSSGFSYGSSTTVAQNQNSSQQIANVQPQETTTTAQSSVSSSDEVSYASLTDLEERINNVGKLAEESISAIGGASSLSDNSSYSSSDVSNSYEISGNTGKSLTELEKKISELETRVDELEEEVYGVTYGSSDSDANDNSTDTSLEQRLAKLETRVTVLESVMKAAEDTLNNIFNNGSSESADDSSDIDGAVSDGVDDALVAGIEKRLAEFMGGTTEEDGGFARIEVAETKEGYVLCSYNQQDAIQPFLLLGGAAQCAGEYQISLYYDNFLPLVEPVALIADELSSNGHNCIKIYLPPDNLTAADAQDLANFIKGLYVYYNIRTYVVHFAGLYASSEKEFLLNNPSEDNLGKVGDLIKEFAQWVKDLGPAAAGVQLGNENEYYVQDAGVFNFSDGEWNTVKLSADAYYSFMNKLAGVYKQIDSTHPVFLGHGELADNQVSLLKNNLTNFDGIAVNSYYNWDEEHKFFKTTMPKEKLEKYFAGQVKTAAALDKPLVISEFSETSYGDLGESGQKEFAKNITEVLGKFMIGADSTEPHIIAGLFWYEYFPEYWKDEIHPSQSGMALFDVVDDQLVAKEAFTELSRGYQAINENLQELIRSVTGEESGQDNNTTVAETEKEGKKVTVYSTPDSCVPCAEVKEFLGENNVEFTEVDVLADDEAAQKIEDRFGKVGVPVIEIDGEMILGFNEKNKEKILAALGIDPSADAAGQKKGENVLDEDDSGRVIILEQGEELTVALSSNLTTGYDWDIYGVDKNILQLEGTNYEISDATDGLVGAGGTTTFYLRAVSPGMTTLVLTYRRPWVENEYSGIFYVTVFVK